MLLRDIIANLDRSDKNRDENVTWGLDVITQSLGIQPWNYICQPKDNPRLKCYWVGKHLCTDTWVGIRAYFLDDEFVAVSNQEARKCGEYLQWVSKECAEKVKQYVHSLMDEDDLNDISLLDNDLDLGEGYTVEYTGQLLTKDVEYNGKMVKVVKDDGMNYTNFHTITVEDESGQYDIDVRDVIVPWPLV